MEGEVEATTVKPIGGGVVEKPCVLLERAGCSAKPEEDVAGRGEYVGVREGHSGPNSEFIPFEEGSISLPPGQSRGLRSLEPDLDVVRILQTLLGHYTPDSCPAYLSKDGYDALRADNGAALNAFRLHTDPILKFVLIHAPSKLVFTNSSLARSACFVGSPSAP